MTQRICIFFEEPISIIGNKAYGRYNWLLYAAEIAKHFDEATFFITAKIETINKEYPRLPKVMDLDKANISFKLFPPYSSLASSICCLPRVIFRMMRYREEIRQAQAILIRVPSICGLLLAEFGRAMGKKIIFSVAGNIETQANPILRAGRLQPIWRLLARTINLLGQFSARNTLVFAVGNEMAKKYSKGALLIPRPIEVIDCPDSMFSGQFLYERQDTCQRAVVRLLRICQIYPSKGIEILLESIKILVDKGVPIDLEIVGSGASDYCETLINLADKLQVSSQVRFLGAVEHQRIMDLCRNADIHVISSWGEGVPRVILEGWAASLPLVSTAVGGIPGMVKHEHNGLLVPPGDPVALA